MKDKLVIGIDFGTDSARGILVNTSSGEILHSAISNYSRWSKGLFCNPENEEYRQHPLDYMEAIDEIFSELLCELEPSVIKNIVAIGTNTTGSTPVAVDKEARPLALCSGFENNPNAMFVLWKDHTAKLEADEINALSKKWRINYTKYSGGNYSSEWFWSKILHIHRKDKTILENAFTWVEQSDWIPNYLIGNNNATKIKRNRCAAGHKAMWNEEHGGLPSAEFLCALDSSFYHFVNRFYQDTYTSAEICGTLSAYFLTKYGFNSDTIVTVGGIDAHHGAVGAGSQPYTLVKVIGTSTCDMLVIPKEDNPPLVQGICGQVDGSIDPDMIGFEAGQSAYGDLYNWFKHFLIQPVESILGDNLSLEQLDFLHQNMFNYLHAEAQKITLQISNIVITDHFNGRRTPDADFHKNGLIQGLSLSTHAGHIFKALVEATAYGSKVILNRFFEYNIPIKSIIATGGIPNKSSYVVQVLADVLGLEIHVVKSDQVCALGSAIFAAYAAGIFESVDKAKQKMAAKVEKTYKPNLDNQEIYNQLYSKYQLLTDL